ncbi:restriction endonuclease subunit S [Cobetia marina]|uniref:restriction endonuclease subunit S n=1 Tax=Cobetia marina TaxID=28258 RepID=UPI000A05DC74|nr:restriction endonuclease subunit S [Cobetia marina]
MSFKAYDEYKDSGVEWLGKVPSHWKISRIKLLAELVTGITPPSDDLSNYADSGWPWLRPDDLDESGASSHGTKFLTTKGWNFCRPIPPHSTLVCCIGSIGKIGFNKSLSCTNQQITSLIPKQSPKFLFYLLKACKNELELYATGNVLRILNAERLGNISIIIPTLPESRKIAIFLDHETARIDALIEEQQRLITLLKEKRQAVISHAVTKGLDPNVPMKDSGVEWLGDVPAHWVKKRLKNISPFITVGIVVNPSSYISEDGLPFIYGGEVKEGFIELTKVRKISRKDSLSNKKTMLQKDDLITMRVGYPGITAVVPAACEGGNCASVMLLKRGSFNSSWLCYVMNNRLIRHQVEIVQYGAAQKQFNIADAIEFWLYTPPANEQNLIAEYLSEEEELFRELTNNNFEAIKLLKERRSALISAAVTGKIDVRDWQPPKANQTAAEPAEASA